MKKLLLFFILLVSVCFSPVISTEDIINIGNKRELFIDHKIIGNITDAQLHLKKPIPQEAVLNFDQPWEGRYSGYITVLKDSEKYRMYYRGLPQAKADGSNMEVTCYAESQDAIVWIKPELGLYEVSGSIKNNVVLAGNAPFSHNFAPFKDTNPDCKPEARYKSLAGTSKTGLWSFYSADGLNWRKKQQVITEGAFDSQNVSFWSEHEQKYICYFRTWSGGGYSGFRSISRTISDDFITWSKPVAMAFGDTQPEHLYTNQTSPYYRAPHIYLGLAARFMPGRKIIKSDNNSSVNIEKAYSSDCSDGVLLTSRGGNIYDRTFMEGFITPGIGEKHWTSRSNYAANGIIPTSDTEMSIYVQQQYGQPEAYLRRFSLRKDGFAAITASYSGGSITTKPLTISGEKLYLNAATSAAGGIKVEIQDISGKPIPGFAIDDAIEIIGNDLNLICTWKNENTISKISSKPVRLHFYIKDAELYSFKSGK